MSIKWRSRHGRPLEAVNGTVRGRTFYYDREPVYHILVCIVTWFKTQYDLVKSKYINIVFLFVYVFYIFIIAYQS